MNGQVYKEVASDFKIKLDDGKITSAKARGSIKLQDEIYVGDRVVVSYDSSEYFIEKVLPRKNILIRPYVANVDLAVIVVAPVPKVDFYVLDKQIVSLMSKNISVLIVVNKSDLPRCNELYKELVMQYKLVADVISISTVTGENIDYFKSIIKNKITVLSGQSAVGKSSLINRIIDNTLLEVGEISRKNKRGKNTTRAIEIIDINNQTSIIDTCGFSSFELDNIKSLELSKYYIEFEPYISKCQYDNCVHINEYDCGVKDALKHNLITSERYQRYVKLYNEILMKEKKEYS